jgi:hypothetical protein
MTKAINSNDLLTMCKEHGINAEFALSAVQFLLEQEVEHEQEAEIRKVIETIKELRTKLRIDGV